MKQHYCIVNDTVKDNLIAFIRTIPVNPRAPMVVEAREETRTDKQNRLMWPLLKDLSDQVVWHGEKLSREEWKDLITVLVNQTQDQEQKSVPGINGGRVYFGVRTSKSSKRYMVDVIEAIYWFGTGTTVVNITLNINGNIRDLGNINVPSGNTGMWISVRHALRNITANTVTGTITVTGSGTASKSITSPTLTITRGTGSFS